MTTLDYNNITIHNIFRPLRSIENSSVVRKNQLGNIYLRLFCGDQKPIEINSKVRCCRYEWDVKKGRLKSRDELSKTKNYNLESIENRIRSIYSEILNKNKNLNLKEFKEIISGEYHQKYDWLQGFEQMVKYDKMDHAMSTQKHYKITLKYIKQFLKSNYNCSTFPVNKVTYSVIDDFDKWLKIEKKCKAVGAGKHHIRINKFLEQSRKKRIIDYNPYDCFEIVRSKSKPRALDKSELNAIEKLDLTDNKTLEKVRDNFIFSSYSGLSHIELITLTRDDISKKAFMLSGTRTKSKIEFDVLLLPKAQELLTKYKNHPDVLNHNSLMPTMTNQRTNVYLKDIQKLCGIKGNLTFHVARHTFATTIVLANGGTLDSLKRMLGHADIKTTQIYGNIKKERVREEMERIQQKLSVSLA